MRENLKEFISQKILFNIEKSKKHAIREKIIDKSHTVYFSTMILFAFAELVLFITSMSVYGINCPDITEYYYRALYLFACISSLICHMFLAKFKKKKATFTR